MFTCALCNIDTSDVATCSLCKRRFDFACAGITETGYRKLGDRRNTWRCPNCRSGAMGLVPKSASEPVSPLQWNSVQSTLNDIMEQLLPLKTLSEDVKSIKNELGSLQKSVEYAHDTIRQYAEAMKSLEFRIKSVEDRTNIIPTLQADIAKLQQEMRDKEQWSRANNVEIKGVPVKTNENLYDIALRVGDAVGCPIKKEDINFIARIPSQQHGVVKPIIVSLNNRYKKEDFIAAARSRKDLRLKELNLGHSEDSRIFVNDHLTVYNKKLLSRAKAIANEKNFQFIWVKHCKIMARKSPISKIFTINTEADLQKIT